MFLIENYLELENHGDTEVRWHLSSLAPPYVKVSDNCLEYTHFNVYVGCLKIWIRTIG